MPDDLSPPNFYLLRNRINKGLSQQRLADMLGTTQQNVARWENGKTIPGPYYRQKLCDLFAVTEQELGWNRDRPGEEVVVQAEALFDPSIPVLPRELVGRTRELTELTSHIFSNHTIAMHGLPGVGKTALALALVYDQMVQEQYCDGVLWATLGPNPQISTHLQRWKTLLGLPENPASCLDTLSQKLRHAIGMRHFLIVIDDVWQIEDALACKVGGPNCTYVLTSRQPEVAYQFSSGAVTTIRELSEEEGITVLKQFVPLPEAEISYLAKEVGGLPLPLILMGKYLVRQAFGGHPRRLEAALQRLRHVEERLLLAEQLSPLERSPSGSIAISLAATIAASEQHLPASARQALQQLAIFPPKPSSFSEEAALAVCTASVETLDILVDAGLLESSEEGRYMLHQTIVDYVRYQHQNRDSRVEERFISYFVDLDRALASNPACEEVEQANVSRALELTKHVHNSSIALKQSCALEGMHQTQECEQPEAPLSQRVSSEEDITMRSQNPYIPLSERESLEKQWRQCFSHSVCVNTYTRQTIFAQQFPTRALLQDASGVASVSFLPRYSCQEKSMVEHGVCYTQPVQVLLQHKGESSTLPEKRHPPPHQGQIFPLLSLFKDIPLNTS